MMKNNWQTKKIGEVCEIKPSKKEARDRLKDIDLVSFLPMEDLGILKKNIIATKIRPLKEVSGSYTYFTDNDVLLAKITPCFENGKLGIAHNLKNGVGFGSSEYIVFRTSGELIPEYLFYFLSQEKFRKEGKILMTGTSGHSRVSKEFVENYNIPFPISLKEQKRIVKILDEVFEKIEKAKENAERNLQNSCEFFEAYLQSVFAYPRKDWEEKRLGAVCEMISRGISPRYSEIKGLCVLNQKCVRNHKINFEFSRLHDFKNKKVISEKFIKIGDVLVNSTGTGTLGRVAQVRKVPIEATVDSHVSIVRPMKGLFYNDFFGYALIFIEKEIAKRGEGCGGQTELARNTLKNDFKIAYPKLLCEQEEIVKKLDEISGQTRKLEEIYRKKLADLEELKKSVLKQAFEGKL